MLEFREGKRLVLVGDEVEVEAGDSDFQGQEVDLEEVDLEVLVAVDRHSKHLDLPQQLIVDGKMEDHLGAGKGDAVGKVIEEEEEGPEDGMVEAEIFLLGQIPMLLAFMAMKGPILDLSRNYFIRKKLKRLE